MNKKRTRIYYTGDNLKKVDVVIGELRGIRNNLKGKVIEIDGSVYRLEQKAKVYRVDDDSILFIIKDLRGLIKGGQEILDCLKELVELGKESIEEDEDSI